MAKTTVIKGRRGFFGWLFLLLFLAFNGLMLLWVGAFVVQVHNDVNNEYGALAGFFGSGILLFFWAAGAVILGLLALVTRGSRTVVIER